MSTVDKAKRNLAAAEGQLEKARYEARKAKVHDFERNNTAKLVLFRSGEEYFKMGGNSALIFFYIIAKQIKWNCRLMPDRDFAYKFPTGVISFRKISKLKQELARVDIKLEKETKEFLTFKLAQKITPSELKTMREAEDNRREQINTFVMPKGAVNPELFQKLRDTLRRSNDLYRAADKVDRDFFYTKLMESVRSALQIYYAVTQGRVAETSGYAEIAKYLYRMLADMNMMTELRMIESRVVAPLCAVMADALTMAGKLAGGKN